MVVDVARMLDGMFECSVQISGFPLAPTLFPILYPTRLFSWKWFLCSDTSDALYIKTSLSADVPGRILFAQCSLGLRSGQVAVAANWVADGLV